MQKAKTWAGQKPEGDDWEDLGTVKAHGVLWGMAIKPYLPSGWATFKVYAIPSASNKANYWGTWNGERVSRGKDMGLAYSHAPDLLIAIEKRLKKIPRVMGCFL